MVNDKLFKQNYLQQAAGTTPQLRVIFKIEAGMV